jgi:hypothetical protein
MIDRDDKSSARRYKYLASRAFPEPYPSHIMAAQQNHSNIPPTNNTAWRYNDMLRLVTHEAQDCTVCTTWGHHYIASAFCADPSLRRAEEQRDNAIRGVLATECNALRDTVEAMRRDNSTLRENLDRMRDQRDDADDDVRRLRSELEDLRNENSDLERRAQETLDELRVRTDSAQDVIADLREQISSLEHRQTPRRRKMARRDSYTTSPSRSRQPSARSSRPDSPMHEDRDALPARPVTAPPHLLSRITISSAEVSPPMHTPDIPPDSSAEHSPSTGTHFLSRIAVPAPLIPNVPSAASYAPTPFIDTVGFHAMLPIIYYETVSYTVDDPGNPAPKTVRGTATVAVPGTVPMDSDGNIDFHAHARYILAIGGFHDNEPSWNTTLIRRERFLAPQWVSNRKNFLVMPLHGIILGGRNGVLISPDYDPKTEAEVEALFTNPARYGRAAGYTERIRFTPPELRGEFHNRALEHWRALKAERRNTHRRAEPSPSATTVVWKRWLKETRENPQSGGKFKYIGIPLVGLGYQTAHIEGARAILSLLPLNPKGYTTRGPIRDAFLRTAATLLCVPEWYTRVLVQLGQDVAPRRGTQLYDEAQFGTAATLSVNGLARFLASVGVTADEAEQWRPWAAAYVEMELEEHPNGTHAQVLRQARDSARAHITSNPKWVFTKLHADAPGNYNPELEKSRAARRNTIQAEANNAEAGPSSAAGKADSTAASARADLLAHPDAPDESEVELDYEDELDEDTRMGPA